MTPGFEEISGRVSPARRHHLHCAGEVFGLVAKEKKLANPLARLVPLLPQDCAPDGSLEQDRARAEGVRGGGGSPKEYRRKDTNRCLCAGGSGGGAGAADCGYLRGGEARQSSINQGLRTQVLGPQSPTGSARWWRKREEAAPVSAKGAGGRLCRCGSEEAWWRCLHRHLSWQG